MSNRDYMKHWTVHMDEFFDHYLLGKPRPEWMDKGVSFLERGTRDVSGMFKKPVVAGAESGAVGRWTSKRPLLRQKAEGRRQK